MESWMVSLGIGIITYIGVLATMKNKIENHEAKHSDQGERNKDFYERLEKHGDDIIRLNTKSEMSITKESADDKYISKEYFGQYQKHMDQQFSYVRDDLGKLVDGQEKLLSFIRKGSNHELH